jgi:hypothetical protein
MVTPPVGFKVTKMSQFFEKCKKVKVKAIQVPCFLMIRPICMKLLFLGVFWECLVVRKGWIVYTGAVHLIHFCIASCFWLHFCFFWERLG